MSAGTARRRPAARLSRLGARGRLRALALPAALAAALALAGPPAALACATCFGAADSPLTTGMNHGILTLLGVVGFVQAGFIALFWAIWRRSRRHRERRESFELIDGGVG